ncbi:MAG TPA: DUF4445 domain-containing protein [Dehalococcoidia bacterium]|nr:DUF4445 domain-containing protein [Dehalococcoidia bacterium]
MSPLHHQGNHLELVAGKTLFDYADQLRVRVPTSCRRNGECHECIVDVRRGMEGLSEKTPSERFLRDSYRLACQAGISDTDGDIEFAILRRQPRILTHSVRRSVPLQPLTFRKGDDVYFQPLVDCQAKRIDKYRGNIFGLAIDAGTTTVVMNLVDLETGEIKDTASFENPQRFGGSDIMNRIAYDGGEFHGELQQVIISSVNFEIGEMARRLRFHRRLIFEVVVVGNSTMRDIFFGVDVQPIGEKPYMSVTELETRSGLRNATSLNVSAKALGIRVFPAANVYGGPLIGCHVGADTAAGLLAVAMDEVGVDDEEEFAMLVDVGTNTEVVVGNGHRMMAASCPAGPAFEGGQISHGMPGYDGAIESLTIEQGQAQYGTIGGGEPEGICGSGLVDLLAQLRLAGMMNPLGVFQDGSSEFYFVPETNMALSRSDISALAQAKAANYSGQYIALRRYGVAIGRLSKLYLAGGFANYVNVSSALEIGFIANVPEDKIVKVGNAALEGATLMLTSGDMRRKAEAMAPKIEHIELETTPDFFDIFVEGCMFKPMDLDLS